MVHGDFLAVLAIVRNQAVAQLDNAVGVLGDVRLVSYEDDGTMVLLVKFLESPDLRERLEARFGSSDIRRRCCADPVDLLLWVETQRFWRDSMAASVLALTIGGASDMVP